MKKTTLAIYALLLLGSSLIFSGCAKEQSDEVVLRVCNWEEYIDEGGWGEDEAITLEDGTQIIGNNSMIEDFEIWYEETYGIPVRVEYSTFGTNEDLYNQLTIGDVFDVVCPSEYMIMKMMQEDMLVPFSEDFYEEETEENYYANGVSPYIRSVYDDLSIGGEPISTYAAGYMWGTLGLVYNPEEVTEEAAQHWSVLSDPEYYKQVTIKDSVRDAYFAAVSLYYYDEIITEEYRSAPDYQENLSEILNRTDEETVDGVEEILTKIRRNAYSFETDSGKADMVTGKVLVNEQWSGDAVYTMDQAEEDGVELCYSAPEEGTNLWFDGWVMLRKGLEQDDRKQHAAEAFINFISRPDNAVRNMYYIGYTSVISGGSSDLIFEYLDWNYGVDPEEEDAVEYCVGYFFAYGDPDADEEYAIFTSEDQTRRQLYAQYPTQDVVDRSVVMACFDDESNVRIRRMWTNVRCFDLESLFRKEE